MTIKKTETYEKWFKSLKDEAGKAHITYRLRRIETEGFFGDCVKIKDSELFELRIHYGPGYRIYFVERDKNTIVLVLRGGKKAAQKEDIKKAKKQAKEN
ncbi:MAG: type II toxin-antitoxin system RelE/ParE family toxin [Treponema sp.]|nr:type II toxin-antitoxin system RelE/ParE family toxin [Treponema sp.]